MDEADIFPQDPGMSGIGLPRNLDDLSVVALKEYKTALENEIARVDGMLEKRDGVIKGAEALFRS
ncbi:DUF1192 domain-containing protein [Thalassospira sp.]|uniref:DUF1192 domain-containing protein n=1 Tax=Thalassospira sp. TaxID=1912094 RepID=UPI002736C9D6|nr:DUF1192 domain-containing protein [Thalassospira sp.]MDP2699880.1 DUF1192 domain-containing protein [Thalassospira sp.]